MCVVWSVHESVGFYCIRTGFCSDVRGKEAEAISSRYGDCSCELPYYSPSRCAVEGLPEDHGDALTASPWTLFVALTLTCVRDGNGRKHVFIYLVSIFFSVFNSE